MDKAPPSSSPLAILPPKEARKILALAALLAIMPRQEGTTQQGLLARASPLSLDNWTARAEWLEEEIPCSISSKQMLRAENLLKSWQSRQLWVAKFTSDGKTLKRAGGCPHFLFGQGRFPGDAPLAAVFNSRKSRDLSSQVFWVQALRGFMEMWSAGGPVLASSLGTLTHDMVTHVAISRSISTVLVVHSSFDNLENLDQEHGFSKKLAPLATLTCRAPGMVCSKRDLMLCRDHLLANLAHEHCILELRPEGNLHRMLREMHPSDSKSLRFAVPAHGSQPMNLHETMAHSISKRATPLFIDAIPKDPLEPPSKARPLRDPSDLFSPPEAWSAYLYHYTRSCWGPWPGQSYEDYLENLFEGRRGSGHTTLDTLVRILTEKRIRASSKTIRGTMPVISWTVHAPSQLSQIRHWNKALMRWTFEPYGIAVLKKRLKALGAKPTIYAPGDAFERLKQPDRYRFQKHEPPDICWRHEREYRLPADLRLDELQEEDFFVFVPKRADVFHLKDHSPHRGRVVITPHVRRADQRPVGSHPLEQRLRRG